MRNRRKTPRNYTYDLSDAVMHSGQTVRAVLSDPEEADRLILLELSTEQAHYLAHRLLHHVQAIERDTADTLYRQITEKAT
jgi:primosomal protein N''